MEWTLGHRECAVGNEAADQIAGNKRGPDSHILCGAANPENDSRRFWLKNLFQWLARHAGSLSYRLRP